jgi:hypothetical protein
MSLNNHALNMLEYYFEKFRKAGNKEISAAELAWQELNKHEVDYDETETSEDCCH